MTKKLTVVFTVEDACPDESLRTLTDDLLPGLRSNFLSWSDLRQERRDIKARHDALIESLSQNLTPAPSHSVAKPVTVAWSVRPVGNVGVGSLYIDYPEWAEGDTQLEVTPLYAGTPLPAASEAGRPVCPACEGRPSADNNPCAVCGRPAVELARPKTVSVPAELVEQWAEWLATSKVRDKARVKAIRKQSVNDTRPYPFNVYINSKLTARVDTEEAAWEVIGAASFGSCHEVRDANGDLCDEFIPY